MLKTIQSWNDYQKGIEVRPIGYDEVNITYNGLLSKSGADQIYLHYGFGDPKRWYNTNTTAMNKTSRGWEKNLRMQNNILNVCFKDSANNWDNNNGFNWTVRA